MLEADVVRDGMMVASIVALTEAMFMVMGIMSVRSVRHLMRAWEAEGFAGVVREGR